MASAKSGVHVMQCKQTAIPDTLVKGERCYKLDEKYINLQKADDIENGASGCYVILRTDPEGHILYWVNTTNSTKEYIEIPYVLDVRWGDKSTHPKDTERIRDELTSEFLMPASDYESCLLTVVCGFDYINLTFLTFVTVSPAVAEAFGKSLLALCTNLLRRNASIGHFLNGCYAKIRYGCSSSNAIPVRESKEDFVRGPTLVQKASSITKVLARNKEEQKAVEKALEVVGFNLEKSSIAPDQFTPDIFYKLYLALMQRDEINEVFESIASPEKTQRQARKRPVIAQLINNVDFEAVAKTSVSAVDGKSSADQTQVITVQKFQQFLNETQRDSRLNEILYPYYNDRSTRRLIKTYEPDQSIADAGKLSLQGFTRFLLSSDNIVLAEDFVDLREEDMNEPLNHYWISSSHNTYLPGNQFGPGCRASVEIYRQVLMGGCRSIELDCYDGQKGEDPIITHGNPQIFFVTPVPFRDVIEATAECAFKTSKYPLTLSFDNSCSKQNQGRMAQILKEVLGDMLLTEPLASHPIEPGAPLPPPSMLQYKILIKNKKVVPTSTQMITSGTTSVNKLAAPVRNKSSSTASAATLDSIDSNKMVSSDDDTIEQNAADGNTDNATPDNDRYNHLDSPCTSGRSQRAMSLKVDSAANDTSSLDNDFKECEVQLAVGSEISALVVYTCAMGGLKSLEDAHERNMSTELYSIPDKNALDLIKQFPVQLVLHHKRQISRTFPRPKLGSANYLPKAFWNAGVQMVALNFQVLDVGMQLNLGLFELNGRCGYVLKPECMRRKDTSFDLFERESVENVVANTCSVQIISGQFLCTDALVKTDDRLSTYVEVEMHGLSIDTQRSFPTKGMHRFRTALVTNNGINPRYNSHPIEFQRIIFPELATLRVVLYDEKGQMLAHCMLPVLGLRPGYRHIVLRNPLYQPLIHMSLFVKIVVKDFVPENQLGLVTDLTDPIPSMMTHEYFANALMNPIKHQNLVQMHEEMLRCLVDDESFGDEPDLNRTESTKRRLRIQAEMEGGNVPARSSTVRRPDSNCTSPRVGGTSSSLRAAENPNNNQLMTGVSPRLSSSVMSPSMSKSRSSTTIQPQQAAGAFTASRSLIETFSYDVPSVADLQLDKHMEKVNKKHDAELISLRDKNMKEYEQTSKRLLKKGTTGASDMQSPSSATGTSFAGAAQTASILKKVKRSFRPSSSPRVQASSSWMVHQRPDPNNDLELLPEHSRLELVEMVKRHQTDEHSLMEKHIAAKEQSLLLVVDQKCKTAEKTLETIFARERSEAMRQNADERKSYVSELAKNALSKAEMESRKKEISDQNIKQGKARVEALMRLRAAKDDELNKRFDALRTKVKSEYAKTLEDLNKQFRAAQLSENGNCDP